MINYLNNELNVSTEFWKWKIKLSSPITCVVERDCGKTFLTELIKSHMLSSKYNENVTVADYKTILNGFEKVTQNHLIVVDDCVILQYRLGEKIFDDFINENLSKNNKFLLFNCDGVGIYIAESRIITFDIDTEKGITTGGF